MSVYGLGEAGRDWYFTFRDWLLERGCKQSMIDGAMFYYQKRGKLRGVLLVHVDDMIHGGDGCFDEDIIIPMFERFDFGRSEEGSFKTLGWNIEHNMENIYVGQREYIDSRLERIHIEQPGMHKQDTPLTPENIKILRRLVGQLRWVTDQTRPDGAFDELWLSIKAGNPTVREYNTANNLVDQALQRGQFMN